MTSRRATDRGSASIWVLAVAALVMVVAGGFVLRTEAVLARHRAQSAADLAALAAAGRIGVATDSCAVAERIAAANGVPMLSCTISLNADGRSGTVQIVVSGVVRLAVIGPAQIRARARAARDPP